MGGRVVGCLFLAINVLACAGEKELQPWELPDYRPGRGPASGEGTYSGGADDGGINGSGANGSNNGGTAADGGPNAQGGPGGPGGSGGQGGGAGDGGVDFARGDGALPNTLRPPECIDLSVCCAQEKLCSAETYACQGAALIGDPVLCRTILTAYEGIGCANKLNLGPAIIPGFVGCLPKPGGGFF